MLKSIILTITDDSDGQNRTALFFTRETFFLKKKKKKKGNILCKSVLGCDWRAAHARLCVKSCQTAEGQQSFC